MIEPILISIFVVTVLLVLYRLVVVGKCWISKRSIPGNIVTLEDELLFARFRKMYQVIVADIVSTGLEKSSPLCILEIGCGIGYGSKILATTGFPIKATDAQIGVREDTAELINTAGLQQEYDNLTFDTGKIEDEPSNFYDIIVCFQVIEHIEDDAQFLKEVDRVLISGGTAFISTVNRAYRLYNYEKPWNSDHIREYSVDMLNQLATNVFGNNFYIHGLVGTTWASRIEYKRVNGSKLRKDLRRMWGTIKGYKKANYEAEFMRVPSTLNALDFLLVYKKSEGE